MTEGEANNSALKKRLDSPVRWRRDPGYFLPVSLFYFLFLAGVTSLSSFDIRALPIALLVLAWAALFAVRILRKRLQRHVLENATILIEPPRPNLGGNITVTLTLTPSRQIIMDSWSVSLVYSQAVTDDEWAEEEVISKLERIQYTTTELTRGETFHFTDALTLPADAPPTALASGFKIAWYLSINVEFAASPVWGLKQPIPLTVLV